MKKKLRKKILKNEFDLNICRGLYLFNCILLTRRIFENNPCATYFLASTYANIIVLLLNNLVTIIQSFGNIQFVLINVIICKIQRYDSWMSRSLSVWLIVLSIIDRYLNSFSDINIRSWSSMKTVKRSIAIITITMSNYLYAYLDFLSNVL
jgi:hypothetical protein